jgi:hypothetical protein
MKDLDKLWITGRSLFHGLSYAPVAFAMCRDRRSSQAQPNERKNFMKQNIRMIKVFLAGLVLVATSSLMPAAPPDTGIQGQSMIYISYGVPIEIEPGLWVGVGDVQMPVATAFSIVSAHSGRELGRFTTDVNGAFSISLPPGKYVVVPDPLTYPFGCSIQASSFEVSVSAKKFTPAIIFYYQDRPCSVFSNSAP